MRPTMRNAVFTFATIGALAACASDTTDGNGGVADRHRRDAGTAPIDSATSTSSPDAGGSTSTSSSGTVSCYSEGTPTASCTLPEHCCFSNYSAQHNGACSTNSCAWGTISCDGPEDCANGEQCCSTRITDSDGVTLGYRMACQASACQGEELCHPDGPACENGRTCVTAYGNDYDLPRTLYICR